MPNRSFFVPVFLILALICGCAGHAKNYRDASGVIKVEHRNHPGINK